MNLESNIISSKPLNAIRSFLTRGSWIIKPLSITAFAHLFCTTVVNLLSDTSLVMDITDYLANSSISNQEKFRVFGIVMPGTFFFDSNSGCYTFDITNFKDTVSVLYKGKTQLEFKEGDNIILNAYFTDVKNKSKIVAYSYVANHSMEAENWQGSSGKIREGNNVMFNV